MLTEAERSELIDRIGRIQEVSSIDRADVARQLGSVPKAIEKAVWDGLAVRDFDAPVITDRKGHPEPDPDLRGNERVPVLGPVDRFDEDPTERLGSRAYRAAVEAYMAADVHPYVLDAWVDHAKTKVGYEIPVTRHFYRYVPPRPLEEIDAEIRSVEEMIQRLLREVTTA
jgi:type I restriction enzyme M protein